MNGGGDLFKKDCGRAHGVRGIDNDGIVRALGSILGKFDAVREARLHPGVIVTHRQLQPSIYPQGVCVSTQVMYRWLHRVPGPPPGSVVTHRQLHSCIHFLHSLHCSRCDPGV